MLITTIRHWATADSMCQLQPYTANLSDDPLSVVLLVLHHIASPSGLTIKCVAVTNFEVSYACLFSQHSFLCATSTPVSCRLLAASAARKWHVYLYLTGSTWRHHMWQRVHCREWWRYAMQLENKGIASLQTRKMLLTRKHSEAATRMHVSAGQSCNGWTKAWVLHDALVFSLWPVELVPWGKRTSAYHLALACLQVLMSGSILEIDWSLHSLYEMFHQIQMCRSTLCALAYCWC